MYLCYFVLQSPTNETNGFDISLVYPTLPLIVCDVENIVHNPVHNVNNSKIWNKKTHFGKDGTINIWLSSKQTRKLCKYFETLDNLSRV